MDSLGDRMKGYEEVSRIKLVRRLPVIIRIDGRAFHTHTRSFERPFDVGFHDRMMIVAAALIKDIQGAKIAYLQSDEISILVTNYDRLETQSWFDNNLQKMVSISASVATEAYNRLSPEHVSMAHFDSRAFVLPKEEVCNYFIWRQQDATRNSIQSAAYSCYSQKQLHKKNTSDMQDMLMEKGINWNDYPTRYRRGACVFVSEQSRFEYDLDTPIFTQDRDYIEKHVFLEEPTI